MTIPSLTAAGLLAAGIHPATLQEVEIAFGTKTDKPNPSDIDVVLILPAPQLKRLMGHADYLKLENAVVKERFIIDLIDPDLDGMATFFQKLKVEDALQRGVPPRHLRGVVQVTL